MITRFISILVIIFSLVTDSLHGQTVFYTESFENTSGFSFPNGNGGSGQDFFDRTNLGGSPAQEVFTYSGFDGSFFIAGEDIDGELSSSTGIVLLSNIDITSYTNLEFRGAFASGTNIDIDDANDAMWVEVRIDGSAWQEIGRFEADPSTTNSSGFNGQFAEDTDGDFDGDGVMLNGNFADFIWPITGTGSTLDVRISMSLDSGDEEAAFDNIRIAGTTSGGTCSLTSSGLNNISCNDNGTSSDATDDFITFNLNPSGSDLGTSYNVSVSAGSISPTSASYGAPTTFSLNTGSAGGGDVDITVTDDTDGTCTLTETITDPGSCSSGGGGSSCPLDLDFESPGGYTTSITEFTDTSNDYFIRTDGSDIGSGISFTNSMGFFFAAQDIDDGGASPSNLFVNNINISGLTDLELNIDIAEDDDGSNEDWDVGDYVRLFYTIDGGPEQNLLWIENDGSTFNSAPFLDTDFDGDGDGTEITDVFQTFTQSISGTGASLDLRIEFNLDSGDEDIALDNIQVCGTNPVGCVHTVSDYFPLSGPAGTEITIVGSGFSPLSEVFLGNISANVIYQTTDTLVAEIPTNASSGSIFVDEAGCLVDAGLFDYLSEDCTIGSPTLIISELCDPQNNYETDRYIEIYNPTNQAINLNGWEVYSISNGGISDQSCTSWPLFGSINPGEALTCGFDFPINGGQHDFTNTNWEFGSGGGIYQCYVDWNGQERDGAALYNGSTRVDAFLESQGSGTDLYSNSNLVRNSNICSSNPNSLLSEWTISPSGVQDAGTGSSTPGSHSSCTLNSSGDPITISAQPSDLSQPICNEPTLTVTASAGSSITYQWFVNDGSDSWTAVLNGSDYSGASSATLTILNLAGKDGYQYYCQMSTGASNDCLNYSNAVQVEVLPNDRLFFRSASVSGQWTDPAIWEFSIDGSAGSYDNACIYPDASNSDEIQITDGSSITVDAEIEVPKVIIEENGTLETLVTTFLTVQDQGSGAEFQINGTWIDNGSTGNSIEFINGSSWVLGTDGTVIKTNTSSVANYRDNYEAGIANIPATAHWVYRREGTNEVSVASIGMYYPNLTFENFGPSTYDPTNTQQFFQGSSDRPVIKGNLDVGGSGTVGYIVRTNNTNSSPLLVEGDLIIRELSSFTNQDDGGSNDGTGIEVRGDIDIEGSLELEEGAVGRGVLILSGSDDQFGLGAGVNVFVNEFEINKPSGQFLTDFTLQVSREARFLSGIFELDELSTAKVVFAAGSVVSGASNASFIDGPVQKFGNTDFTFPVGDTRADGLPFYQPARIFMLTGFGGFEAQYFAEAHPNAGAYYDGESNNPQDFHEISNCQFWNIDRTSGSTVNARIGLTYVNPNNLDANPSNDNCDSIGQPASVFIARWNPIASDWEASPGIAEGSTTGSSEAISDGVLLPGLGGYGDFALTSSSPGFNILPITLLSFQAEAVEGLVHTRWVTASEINNDFFTVERSKDGTNWEAIGTVDGAGDSNTELSYGFVDDGPYAGISYYRLRQTDFDGKTTVSEPRAVEILQGDAFGLDRVYRGQDGLNLIYRSTAPYLVVEIYDLVGKRVHGELIENYGNGFSTIYPDLAKGAYILRLSRGSEMDAEKFVY